MKEKIEKMEETIYIFGAHSRGQTLAAYLKYLYPDTAVAAFLYDNEEKNPHRVGDVPVIKLDRCGELHGCEELEQCGELHGCEERERCKGQHGHRELDRCEEQHGCEEPDRCREQHWCEEVDWCREQHGCDALHRCKELHQCKDLHREYPVYLGTKGMYHGKITEHLRRLGFTKIIPVTAQLDLELRNAYLGQYYPSVGREFVKIEGLGKGANAKVYVAMSAFDRPLEQAYEFAPYEAAIQAGAALTEKRLWKGILTDDVGENISGRNRQFCELTALYWIWRHAEEEIVGLVHYRRHFILPQDWVLRMQQSQVDVILPIPLYVAPSLEGNFKDRHDPGDWDYMMEFLKERDREEYQEAQDFFQKNLYSPCNMFIMRREVLDELCRWLFPILFAVAEHGGQKEDAYLNRYPGFLSERLITFYFERHRGRYKVVYSDKNFLT